MAHVHVSQVCWQIYGDARCTWVENLLVQVPSGSKAMLFVTFGNISAQVELPVLEQQGSLEVSLNAFQFNCHSKPKFKTGLETPLMSERKKNKHIYQMQQIKKIDVNKYLIW